MIVAKVSFHKSAGASRVLHFRVDGAAGMQDFQFHALGGVLTTQSSISCVKATGIFQGEPLFPFECKVSSLLR